MRNTDQTPNKKRWFANRNSRLAALAIGTAVAIGGAVGIQAATDTKAYAHMKLIAGGDGGWHGERGWHKAGWRQGRHTRWHELSDTEIEARIERVVKHVAIEIDATPEQQQKITALVTALAKDVKPMHQTMRETGREVHELLLAPTIDRAKLEALRAERVAEVERLSKELVEAVADVAEVLTPEQRKVLDERIGEFRGMRRWHRG